MAFGKKGKQPRYKQNAQANSTCFPQQGQPIYANSVYASTSTLNPVPPYTPPYPPRPAVNAPFQQTWNSTQSYLPPSAQPSPPSYALEQAPQPYLTPESHQSHKWKSCTNLETALVQQPVQAANASVSKTYNTSLSKTADCWKRGAAVGNAAVQKTTNYLNWRTALCDQIGTKFNDVITLMDEECFHGGEKDLFVTNTAPPTPPQSPPAATGVRGGGETATVAAGRKASKGVNQAVTSAVTSTNYFSKANLYANSRLPPHLPPLRVYMPTWPLLCLAAQYSQRVYHKPQGAEKDTYVNASRWTVNKAMVIKSVPIDDMNTIVFAIRGTQTFMDWAVNLNSAPASPAGFLDDEGNLCHAGFLDVAKKMVEPVADRLAQILQENPGRIDASLVITGHSAGGAVASLLFCHMLSQKWESPEHNAKKKNEQETRENKLRNLTGVFKRIHCVTFGAPPVSLLPLAKPENGEKRLRKSLFMSFINEFDPVPRADKAYIKSLVELYASPAPKSTVDNIQASKLTSTSKLNLRLDYLGKGKKPDLGRPKLPDRPKTAPAPTKSHPQPSNIVWEVPPATLCNAGRLVVLRLPYNNGAESEEDVRACITSDEQLRKVVFGDPLMHQMRVYEKRIEILATKAVTGRLVT